MPKENIDKNFVKTVCKLCDTLRDKVDASFRYFIVIYFILSNDKQSRKLLSVQSHTCATAPSLVSNFLSCLPLVIKALPFPTSRRILEALRVEWQNSMPHFLVTRENENIKYLISSRWNRPHNQSRLQSHVVPLRHDGP